MALKRMPSSWSRRRALVAAGSAALLASGMRQGNAQDGRNVQFALDGRIDGPAACLVVPQLKGHYRQEGLNVTFHTGNGPASAIARVAGGSHEMGVADLAALMEFHANAPAAVRKPVAVMIVHGDTASAVLALRRSGIARPADLKGRRIGAPLADAGRRMWSVFARANAIDDVAWTATDAALTETMLVRGEVDAITGPAFDALPNLEARGVRDDEVLLLPYAQYGVRLYGSALIAGEEFMRRNPERVKALLRAFTRGTREVIADPRGAIALLRAGDAALDPNRELRRLRLALELCMLTPDVRAGGFGNVTGPRLALMSSQVSDAFATRERVNPNAVWNGSFLPSVGERNVFSVARRA